MKKTIIICVLFFCVSCSDTTMNSICGQYDFQSPNNAFTASITLFKDGTFLFSREYDNIGLETRDDCANQKGIWQKKGCYLYLTTEYQRELKDFFYEMNGNRHTDSICIKVVSMKDKTPKYKWPLFFPDGTVFESDSNGIIVVPNENKDSLSKALEIEFGFGYYLGKKVTVHLSGNSAYILQIPDCVNCIMKNDVFLMMDSSLIDCSTIYKRTKNGSYYQQIK